MTEQHTKPEPPFAWAARRQAEQAELERARDAADMADMETGAQAPVEDEVDMEPARPVAAVMSNRYVVVVCDDGAVWQQFPNQDGWSPLPPIPGTPASAK